MKKDKSINELVLSNNYLVGDNNSLGNLYLHYYQSLVLIAYKYTSDTEKSRDVVGAVFEKLLLLPITKRQEIMLHPQKGIYPFLVTVVKNKCLDNLKSNKLHSEIKNQLVSLFQTNSTNTTFIRFELDAITLLLSNLPKREKEIIELHLQGYKNEEIATQLAISYNTVRNTLHTAKQRIKKLWHLFM